MGEPSKDSSVEKLCESMQRMLMQLMEQAQGKTGSTSQVQKVLIEQNPVNLTGPGDYFSWARNASLVLESHGLHKYLNEDEKKPEDITQEQWDQNQKRVMVWLLSSMEKSVREQVENFKTAAEVWTGIEKQFSGKSNKMQVSRILHEMRHIKQDQKSVTEFAGELKKLYIDLEFFRPFKPHDPRDLTLFREWFESLLVQILLEGLNPEFHLRSQLILATSEWPTLDETITSILEEETRLSSKCTTIQVHGDNRAVLTHVQAPAAPRCDQANAIKSDYRHRKRWWCAHCKRPGHVKENCFDLVGYPPSWQHKQVKSSVGSSKEKMRDKTHFTSSSRELPAAAMQALEEFKEKLIAASKKEPNEASKSHGPKVTTHTWDWD